ncbi:MAG TPA: SAF domain-containing protein [Mycobacterium sp.]|mgnify:FL=1|nr:SAF domain-containing protein [Mycobacterium sp.]
MGSRRTESLNPTLPNRIRQALQPDWVHTAKARRIAAGVLVLLAAVTAIRAQPGGEHAPAAVALRDLEPGVAITADDVRIENRLAATLPDAPVADTAAVVGAMPAGPVRRGEILTDVRLLGARLAQAAAGPDARLVPLHVTDRALPDLLRPGDIVDVVAAPASGADGEAHVVATDAVVASVSARPKTPTVADDRVVLVALPVAAANAVAGATLAQTVTLTLH